MLVGTFQDGQERCFWPLRPLRSFWSQTEYRVSYSSCLGGPFWQCPQQLYVVLTYPFHCVLGLVRTQHSISGELSLYGALTRSSRAFSHTCSFHLWGHQRNLRQLHTLKLCPCDSWNAPSIFLLSSSIESVSVIFLNVASLFHFRPSQLLSMMSRVEGKIPNDIRPGQCRMEDHLSCELSASTITVQDPSSLTGDLTPQLQIVWTHTAKLFHVRYCQAVSSLVMHLLNIILPKSTL